jgi:hypothetical protein
MNLTRAWLLLMAFSAASTTIAASGQAGLVAALVILALAWAKALVILRQYLGLARAPAWSGGFATVLGGYMILVMGLAAAAG